MKNNKLILDYSKLSDAKLSLRSGDVVNSLTDNDYFPVTVPSLTEFTALRTAFVQALDRTTTGDRYLIAVKNQTRKTLLSAMRQLAMTIDAQGNGDKAKLITSGFLLSSTAESSTLGAPENFKIADGKNPSELILSCKMAQNAASYLFDIAEEPISENTIWKTQADSRRSYTFRNLNSGSRIFCRIRAIGRKGQEISSEVLSRVVQ